MRGENESNNYQLNNYIYFYYTTMKGCMSQGKAAGVLAITGIIIGGVIALL